MIRFRAGKSTGIYSQHSDGAAFSCNDDYIMLEDRRPYVYSELGSHANYPASGYDLFMATRSIASNDPLSTDG
ncbi:hypothetical protein MY11210_005518 [Beauveria gryllotalpidicola]